MLAFSRKKENLRVKICCVQMDVCAAEPEQNFVHAESLIREAATSQPDVILLPELWNTGFAPKAINPMQADESGARTKTLCGRLAKELGVNIVAGSVLTKKADAVFNTAYVFDRRGDCVAEYDKTHLFSLSGEGECYTAGDRLVTFPLDGVTCGILICYDLRFPELCRALALSGARILFIPAEWRKVATKQMRALLDARAIENQVFAVLCNGCGEAFGAEFGGNSAIVDPLGNVLAQAGEKEEIIFYSIDLEAQKRIREELPVFSDRRPELYLSLCKQTKK